MVDFKFDTLNDLYKRLMPALTCKKRELCRLKLFYLKEIDIWNYLVATKWQKKEDIRIHELVEDILEVDELQLLKFYNINNR